jgi:LTXXQ motif family protein
MKKKTLVISVVAATTVLVGGWAVAQSVGPGPMGFGPPFMHGQGPEGMGWMGHGPGMMRGMGHGMGPGMMMNGHGMMKGMGPWMMQGVGPGMMHGGAGFGFADPAQLETLKAELKITPAQEQAWSKYAKAIDDAASTMKTARESVDPQAVSNMAPADRYAFVSKMREQGQKQFGAVKSAADELLATLDATQKAKAAEILPGLAFGPPMRGAFAGNR